MLKISDAVRAIMHGNAFLRFGLHHRLLNLSQLARFITPLVEARTKKEVQPSAVLMSLSRLGKDRTAAKGSLREFQVENISVQSELCVLTLPNTKEAHRIATGLYQKLQSEDAYVTITEGINEITFILENRYLGSARKALAGKILFAHQDVASISVKFDQKYIERPGFLYLILQQVAFQNVNIVEVASTSTEFILYVAESDVRLVFDTLYQSFGGGRGEHSLS